MDVKFFNSLYDGDSPNGVKLGMVLTGGDFWPRLLGCQNLYRGESMLTIDFDDILVVTDISEGTISPPTWLSHQPASVYFYVARRVNGCGVEEHSLCAFTKVAFDSEGNLVEPRCNNIFSVKAYQVFGNKVRLIWYYWPIAQDATPDHFNIYSNGGSGEIDYENTIAEIDYNGQKFYSWQSGSLNTDKHLFCIRAVSQEDLDDGFLGQIRIHLNTIKPDAVEILQAEVI